MNKDLIVIALRHHDGQTLMPEWPREKQIELSRALDELRAQLLEQIEQSAKEDRH